MRSRRTRSGTPAGGGRPGRRFGGRHLSTCNRVEVGASRRRPADGDRRAFLSVLPGWRAGTFRPTLPPGGERAVRHPFRVREPPRFHGVGAADPGAGQGRLRWALRPQDIARARQVLTKAFSVAKRVRTEDPGGQHAVSVSYAAVELRRRSGRPVGQHRDAHGAGEMCELARATALRRRPRDTGTNRTCEARPANSLGFDGTPVRRGLSVHQARRFDLSSTAPPASSSPRGRREVIRVRKNRPLFFIAMRARATSTPSEPGRERLRHDIDARTRCSRRTSGGHGGGEAEATWRRGGGVRRWLDTRRSPHDRVVAEELREIRERRWPRRFRPWAKPTR